MLGSKLKWTFCSGSVAMSPTSEIPTYQPFHPDTNFEYLRHSFSLVVNEPLGTMTHENGLTEMWLRTHTDTGLDVQERRHERSSGSIKSTAHENRRVVRAPCQPVVPKEFVAIRNLQLWHCGVGNQTEDVRVMLP
ncbi:hypothetical protein PISL3812_06291 [Talaromyces islandicus]|uniref:TauD/TfdA-like domain-containing protein n=1 Tax=Talaromyces islandicus TaxID=28573 RepID=A0A0U1M0Z5_TALIS|nr:hypothetical protein PISL3812_06291 [Talaromyces islandicus]